MLILGGYVRPIERAYLLLDLVDVLSYDVGRVLWVGLYLAHQRLSVRRVVSDKLLN